jgi:hypothetical protein
MMPALRASLVEPLRDLYTALERVASEENAARARVVAAAEAAIGKPGAFGQLVWAS